MHAVSGRNFLFLLLFIFHLNDPPPLINWIYSKIKHFCVGGRERGPLFNLILPPHLSINHHNLRTPQSFFSSSPHSSVSLCKKWLLYTQERPRNQGCGAGATGARHCLLETEPEPESSRVRWSHQNNVLRWWIYLPLNTYMGVGQKSCRCHIRYIFVLLCSLGQYL